MNLPELDTQALYLHTAWGVVLSAAAVAIVTRGQRDRAARRRAAAACLVATALVAVPDDLSPIFWLGMAFQHPSLVLTGLAAIYLAHYFGGRPAGTPPVSLPPWPAATLAALGLALYAGTFLWLPYDLYQFGYWGYSAAVLSSVLVAFWWAVAPSCGTFCLVVALSALVHAATRLPSGNAWDALLDPMLFAWAAATTIAGAARLARRRAAA